jgi:UDP-N-acetylmuramoyl-tripeptide--D-alanyl-D-alanine ligase
VAVLGDMRELGNTGPSLHAGLAEPLAEASVDLVFTAGPLMEALARALPAGMVGGHAGSADELEPLLAKSLTAGDVVMVKGSNASRMGALVEKLRSRLAPQAVVEEQETA